MRFTEGRNNSWLQSVLQFAEEKFNKDAKNNATASKELLECANNNQLVLDFLKYITYSLHSFCFVVQLIYLML